MSDEPKHHLRDLAEEFLQGLPDSEFAACSDNQRYLHAKLLDLAESVWLAGYIAGKNGCPQVNNPYSVLCDADREFVRAASGVFTSRPASEEALNASLFPTLVTPRRRQP